MSAGKFIVFEGGEASGKTTQAARLAAVLDAVLTREPGGTEVGRAIRSLLLEPGRGAVGGRTEALLMAADRAQHVEELITPNLFAGRHVVSDRYAGSSIAYQGYGRGLPVEEVRQLSDWATGELEPDLVILLDVPVEEAAARRAGTPDRMEAESTGFHLRVRDGFLALAVERPERWAVVDGSGPIEQVSGAVDEVLRARLGLEA